MTTNNDPENTCKTCGSVIPEGAPGGLCPACVLVGSCSEAPAAGVPSDAQIAAAFPELQIVGLVGRGGMGAVYHARQENLDRDLALKILLPDLGDDPAFAERFSREARALAKLNHPNIVAVYDFGERDGLFYLMMEFVDGVNLRQAMAAGRFTPEQALAVVPGVCDALQSAHAKGILHRDIKPENILLDKEGKVKIVDFGIARLLGDTASDYTLTESGAVLGSRQYMAPEQLERTHLVDHRADIYSLGVVLYEMLTGELPIGRFLPPSEKSATTEEIDAVVMRALEKELDRRFQKIEEVKTEVGAASARRGETAGSGSEEKAADWGSQIWPWIAGALLIAVLPIILVGAGLRTMELSMVGWLLLLLGYVVNRLKARDLKHLAIAIPLLWGGTFLRDTERRYQLLGFCLVIGGLTFVALGLGRAVCALRAARENSGGKTLVWAPYAIAFGVGVLGLGLFLLISGQYEGQGFFFLGFGLFLLVTGFMGMGEGEAQGKGPRRLLLLWLGLVLVAGGLAACAAHFSAVWQLGSMGNEAVSPFWMLLSAVSPTFFVAFLYLKRTGLAVKNARARSWIWAISGLLVFGIGLHVALNNSRHPFRHSAVRASLKIWDPQDEIGDASMREIASRAAGDFADDYRIAVGDGGGYAYAVTLEVLHQDRLGARPHANAYFERLRSLLPEGSTRSAVNFRIPRFGAWYSFHSAFHYHTNLCWAGGAALAAIGFALLGIRSGLLGFGSAVLCCLLLMALVKPGYGDGAPRLISAPAPVWEAEDRAAADRNLAEHNLAVTRAEALNMAIAAFAQSRGKANAQEAWHEAGNDRRRYELLASFLAFAPRELDEYVPVGFEIQLPKQISGSADRVTLIGPPPGVAPQK